VDRAGLTTQIEPRLALRGLQKSFQTNQSEGKRVLEAYAADQWNPLQLRPTAAIDINNRRVWPPTAPQSRRILP
jgi:hypothetical protein